MVVERILANEAATDKMRAAAMESGHAYALLTPAIPLPATPYAGWFGDAPQLPADTPWPSVDGKPLLFLCQINLAALPKSLWSGLGPRRGWLAFFLPATDGTPIVLHVDGELSRRSGPLPTGAVWFSENVHRRGPLVHDDVAPQWPIAVSAHTGEFPLPIGYKRGMAPGFADLRVDESADLSNPAIHPFDQPTRMALIDAIKTEFDNRLSSIEIRLTMNLRDKDRAELESARAEMQQTIGQFAALAAELLPTEPGTAPRPFSEVASRLAALQTYDLFSRESDAEKYDIVKMVKRPIGEKPRPIARWWWTRYAAVLDARAASAYRRNPDSLPPAVRARLEEIWQFDALHEQGAMGHAPKGHVYTPHGPATPNEVLLELPSSELVGWKWGSVYSIVFFIRRKDLAKGDFRNISREITN